MACFFQLMISENKIVSVSVISIASCKKVHNDNRVVYLERAWHTWLLFVIDRSREMVGIGGREKISDDH